ncbi:RidA family protein [Apibacter raozihei]|uniref:RidA family protein n=1 Tax=Apibacter raozihei TaxID=2500547 RepID=UPI000FE31F9C|nr:RidA family protein [Apibacter raozihei]
MQIIPTSEINNGHYSPAIISGNFLFISGQLPIANGNHYFEEDFETQAKIIFKKLDSILSEAGCTKNHLVKVTVYMTNIGLWDSFDRIYASYLGKHKPSRCIVPVPELHYGYLLEIEAIAEIY